MYIYIHVYVYVYVYIHIYTCVYACMRVYIYICLLRTNKSRHTARLRSAYLLRWLKTRLAKKTLDYINIA